jgi:transposase
MITRPTREQLRALIERDPEAVIDLIEMLFDEIEKISTRIRLLEDRLAKNSANSSKPPSSDSFTKKVKSLRKSSRRKPGGQKGHKFETLRPVSNPDKTVIHELSECTCGCDLSGCQKEQTHHQVFDIPEIKIEVTDHVVESAKCPSCGNIARSVEDDQIGRPAQYGKNIQSLSLYLMNYQLLPYDRTREFFRDLAGINLSTGTLNNWNRRAFKSLATFEAEARLRILASPVIHNDETGARVDSKLHWLHVASTENLTLLNFHPKRGREAMNAIGILPYYKGISAHDYWRAYYGFDFDNALCNAHLLRELLFLYEEHSEKWASQMSALLLEIKEAVDAAKRAGKKSLSPKRLYIFNEKYSRIIKTGRKKHPECTDKKAGRGRKKRSLAGNLLLRLETRRDDILRFAKNFKVPFDNNQAERDLRMSKAKQKISGCFRSFEGAMIFARIRSYISTSRKNKIQILDSLRSAIAGNAIQAVFC